MMSTSTLTLVILVAMAVTTVQGEVTPVIVNTYGSCANADGTLEKRVQQLESIVLQQQQILAQLQVARELDYSTVIRDCSDLFNNGSRSSAVYSIKPSGSKPFKVYCLFDNEGAWTVLQRRTDGSTNFQRNWLEYRNGFGRLDGNHWLGNEYIHAITNQRQYEMRVDITDWDANRLHAAYKFFQVNSEEEKYSIHYANYTGTAGDSLANYHQGMKFSTFEQDNDATNGEHCAVLHGGGWWYNDCDNGNLNGYYNYDPDLKGPTDKGIEWNSWKQLYSFKETMMRVRPTFND